MKIALTYGEPTGIGPEILAYILQNNILDQYTDIDFHIFGDNNISMPTAQWHTLETYTGDASYAYTKHAIEWCMSTPQSALVTGPIDKSKWISAGHDFAGGFQVLPLV